MITVTEIAGRVIANREEEVLEKIISDHKKISSLRDELSGIEVDLSAGRAFDYVCRETLMRVIDGLSNIGSRQKIKI